MSNKTATPASEKDSATARKPRPDARALRHQSEQANAADALAQALNAPARHLSPADLLALQRTAGNRAVQQMLAARVQSQTNNRMTIQTKLAVGSPGDEYEREADRVAAQVMSMPVVNTPSVQRKTNDEEELQMKPLAVGITPFVQRAAIPDDEELQMKQVAQGSASRDQATVEPGVEATIERSRGGGQSLPQDAQVRMERVFGADFSGVRIHTDDEADRLNHSLQARAFTTGHDLFFKRGEYNPLTSSGQELIAHELTHVVQQNKVSCKKKDIAQGDSLASEAAHHIHSVQERVIQGAFDIKDSKLADSVKLDLQSFLQTAATQNDFKDAAELDTYVNTVGEAKFKDLVNVKKLDGKALKQQGAAMLKTFVGVGDKTMKHVAEFDRIADLEIKGTHDEDTFRAKIAEKRKFRYVSGSTPVTKSQQDEYDEALKKWEEQKKTVLGLGKPFKKKGPEKPQPAPVYTEVEDTNGEITGVKNMKMNEVKELTYKMRKSTDAKLSGAENKKTTIKDLAKDAKKWKDFANEAIWDSIREGNFKVGQWQGKADNKVKVEGYYRSGDEVETFYCIE